MMTGLFYINNYKIMNKKNIYIEFFWSESYTIDVAKENLKYSRAYKYLKAFSQSNSRYYDLFTDIEKVSDIDSEELKNYHIIEVEAKWYSQWDYQSWTLYFDKQVLKDKDALEDIKYFTQDLQYYFTAENILINWYIEDIKIIDWKEYKHKERLDGISYEFKEWVDEKELENNIKEFLDENWIEQKDYNIIYDIIKINY